MAGIRAELLTHTLGAGYRVNLQCQECLAPVYGDRTEFETVIVNLAINARDAMPEGGTVTIDAEEEMMSEGEPPHPPELAPGRYIRVRVIDTGTGMDEHTLARVGEAFFTTKGPGKGTGLGLAMARGFASHVGGALHIESAVGKGTTITLWLAAS